jgi:hypothetical protein
LSEKLSVTIVIEFAIVSRENEQDMPPAFLVKDEHLGLGIPLCHPSSTGESFLICPIFLALAIVKEIAAIAVNKEYDFVLR